MTMQQHPPNVKATLEEMGYSPSDVERVMNSEHGSSIPRAVEYLTENPQPTPPEKNITEYPHLASAQNATSVNSSPVPANQRGINNARDSLDGIQVKRMSGADAAPGQTTDNSRPYPEDDLQKAIELSKQDHDEAEIKRAIQRSKEDGTSAKQQEETDYMRAIQESLKENQQMNDERAGSWQSHGFVNIKDRARKSVDEPVGLKNVGNTCYLNSLLQVYFHLPDFRRAIMKFRGPAEIMNATVEDNRSLRDQSNFPQPTVEMPDEETNENETPQERLERMLHASQPDQSFGPSTQVDQVMQPVDETSGLSGNNVQENKENSAVKHAMGFVLELQKLFAAMALGNQNCVDPTEVVRAMRDAEGKPIIVGTQQDASEFNHLFIDIVERGLRAATNELEVKETESSSDRIQSDENSATLKIEDSGDTENVIKDMFTARFRQEVRRITCANALSNRNNEEVQDTMGETNAIFVDATAKKYRDIHSGLEDYAYASIDEKVSRTTDGNAADVPCVGVQGNETQTILPAPGDDVRRAESNCPALKSVWFTRMPPFVVIYLQRVRFNRAKGRAEKVHDKYDFSTQLAFDRYLLENREASAKARGVVQRIRRDRDSVQGLIDRYDMFPSRETKTESVSTNDGKVASGSQDPSHTEAKQVGATVLGTATTPEVIDLEKNDANETFFDAADRVRARLQEALNPSSSYFAVDGISEENLHASIETLKAVLQQDQEKHRSLKRKLDMLHEEEAHAYVGLDKQLYHLHAVLVHDGAPSSGHYWTFIRNWKSSNAETKWMKLSDSLVTYVSEGEMLEWSVGGRNSASAYCLIYGVEGALRSNMDGGESIAEESRRLLPQCRLDEVEMDCEQFQRELNEQTMT